MRQVIGAEEIDEFGLRVARAEFHDRIDREGRKCAPQFKIVDGKERLAFGGSGEHIQARLRLGWRHVELVRRNCGRHKDDPLELQLFERFAGEDQMPVMNRIERAAVDSNFAQSD